MFEIPIVVFCYKRLNKTKLLLDIIKTIEPKKVYLIHDGPKNLDDIENYNVLKLIKEINLNDKKIITSKVNLGLKKRIVSGLNQVFENENKAIILEDDCLPDKSFFYFCEKILNIYEKDKTLAGVTGNNFQKDNYINDQFYFSKFSHIWGWATWKHVWDDFDLKINFWNDYKYSDDWKTIHKNKYERNYWTKIYDKIVNSNIESWAYSNQLCNWYFKRLTVTPKFNLVKNIGFDNFSTNTKNSEKNLIKETQSLQLDKIKKKEIIVSEKLDEYVFKNIYLSKTDRIKFLIDNLKRRFIKKI